MKILRLDHIVSCDYCGRLLDARIAVQFKTPASNWIDILYYCVEPAHIEHNKDWNNPVWQALAKAVGEEEPRKKRRVVEAADNDN
jgi:hypothetical protein